MANSKSIGVPVTQEIREKFESHIATLPEPMAMATWARLVLCREAGCPELADTVKVGRPWPAKGE